MRAMILAAGRGERMGATGVLTPKALLGAGGTTLIEHTLAQLAAAGFDDVVINLAHQGRQILDRLGDGRALGVRIRYAPEPYGALESGGGLRNALPLLGDGPFLVVNGDLWCEFPFARLRGAAPPAAHLVLVPNPHFHRHGDFGLDGDRVRPDAMPRRTYAGIAVLQPRLLDGAPRGRYSVVPLLRAAMARGAVTGELFEGVWWNVGTASELERLRASLGAPR